MNWKSALYALLKYSNDVNAVNRALKTNSPKPVARRVARRAAGKATGKIFRKFLG